MSTHDHHPNLAWPPVRRVKGNYYGTPFRGTVITDHAHTINWNVRALTIRLDMPTAFLGSEPRDTLLVSVCGACGKRVDGWGDMNVEFI